MNTNYTTTMLMPIMPPSATETIVVEKFDDKGKLIERITTTKSTPNNVPTPWWEQPFTYPTGPTYGPLTITCSSIPSSLYIQ